MNRYFLQTASIFVLALLAAGVAGPQAAKASPPESGISIDASKSRAPISKYVYGQFIEHLGRCINGGIWAEMIQDRKFFDDVGGKSSPWKAIGPAGSVTMDKVKPFVGVHTPKITLPGNGKPAGICQGGLALRKGKEYVGRILWSCSKDVGHIDVNLLGPGGLLHGTHMLGHSYGNHRKGDLENSADEPFMHYDAVPLHFTATADTDDGRLEITAKGSGSFHVGAVSLMPADNVHGLRADTLALLRELDAPVYRWPGGNFVSGYNWRDGIGDRDRRPPRKNPAWEGVEYNDFGMDEFMQFCRELKTEPYITVNTGLGEVDAAVEELQYANAPADTPLGSLRAAGGHPQPYAVKLWSIGNEMYGNWQLGHVPLEKYEARHNRFVAAMRAADPSIKVVGDGSIGPWSEGMLRQCADQMDFISEHFYCGSEKDELLQHVRLMPKHIRSICDAHRNYSSKIDSLKGKDIRIALDEWNYWYGPHLYDELGTRYFLQDALGIAAGLHEYFRQSDLVFMANYAQTVNVLGCIKTTKSAASFDPPGLALALYRAHFGVVPVAVHAVAPLDVAAAWTADRRALTIGIVNPTMKPMELPLDLQGATLRGSGQRWQIAGNNPLAYNEPGKKPGVTIEQSPVEKVSGTLSVAPCSVTLYRLDVK